MAKGEGCCWYRPAIPAAPLSFFLLPEAFDHALDGDMDGDALFFCKRLLHALGGLLLAVVAHCQAMNVTLGRLLIVDEDSLTSNR